MRFFSAVLLATCLVASRAQAPISLSSSTSFSSRVELTTAAEIAAGTVLDDLEGAANASGVAYIEYSSFSNVLSYRIDFSRLSSAATLAHFHLGAADESGPVVALIAEAPELSSSLTGFVNLELDAQVDDAVMALLAGNIYINLHTANNPATGELRGQIIPAASVAESFEVSILCTPEAVEDGGVPLAVPSVGSGVVQLSFDAPTMTLNWFITYEDLTSPTSQAHFHGPATSTTSSGNTPVPMVGQNFVSGTAGWEIITAEQVAELQAGLWYINIHTDNNPAGELRGQVLLDSPPPATALAMVYRATATLSPAAILVGGADIVVPSNASGTAIVQLTTESPYALSWFIAYQDLTSPTMFAHFHGPAPESQTAGVQVTISEDSFVSPHSGSVAITDEQAERLLAGQWYVNIHSMLNRDAGELRGQVENFRMVEIEVAVGGGSDSGTPGVDGSGESSAAKVSCAAGLVLAAVTSLLLK